MSTKYRILLMGSLLLSLAALVTAGIALLGPFRPHPAAVSSPSPGRLGNDAAGVTCFGYADVEPGCTPLYPLQPGRVSQVLVHENDRLQAGAPILSLEDTGPLARVAEARAALQGAEVQLDLARQGPERHAVLLAAQQDAVAALGYRLSAARHLLAHKQELGKSELMNSSDIAAAEDQVRELERMIDAERNKLAELRLHNPAAEGRRAEAEVAAMRARLRQAEQALEECTLRAPQAGAVVRILVSPGEVLALPPRQPAVLFVADGPRIVRAEVEQEFAGRMTVGQAVRVQDDIDSRLVWSGRVTRVSDWYLPRRSVLLDPTRFNDTRTLECIITLEDSAPQLRIGQRVRVLTGGEVF